VSAVDAPRDHTLALLRATAALLFAAWVACVLALGERRMRHDLQHDAQHDVTWHAPDDARARRGVVRIGDAGKGAR
jgi:hypothetical protein